MNTWPYDLYSTYRKQQEQYSERYFAAKGYQVQSKYPYILKDYHQWKQNIILYSVYQYILSKKLEAKKSGDPFPIHKYIHHGLSSQAMLFNLFGDPLLSSDHKFFQDVFQFSDISIEGSCQFKFEHFNRDTFNEGQQQPTSFDFTILNPTSKYKNIFVEAKYVETEFGGCSAIKGGECDGLNPISNPITCYLTHKGRTYWDIMRKFKLDQQYHNTSICPFALYYQFYRELMFALENNGYFVLLVDQRNPAFQKTSVSGTRGLIPILVDTLPSQIKNQIKTIYIQDVLPKLEKHGYTWVDEFREKYGM